MEIVAVKRRRIFKANIEAEDHTDTFDPISHVLDYLKVFITSVITGEETSGFSRLLLQESIQHCSAYGKSEYIAAEVENHLDSLISQMILQIDEGSFDADPSRVINKIALKHVDKSHSEIIEHFHLFNKFEICWCHLIRALGHLVKVFDPLETYTEVTRSGFRLMFAFNRTSLFRDKAISIFVKDKEDRPELYQKLEAGLLSLVRGYRLGVDVNFCQLYNVMEMLTCMKSVDSFEKKLLEETSMYYKSLAREYMHKFPFYECFRKFSSIIEFERHSCEYYLSEKLSHRVVELTRKELLFVNADQLLRPENLEILLKKEDLESIQLVGVLYMGTEFKGKLLDNIFICSLNILNATISNYLSTKGYTDSNNFIDELEHHQSKLDRLFKPMMDEDEYSRRLKDTFITALNDGDEKIEFVTTSLAKYVDGLHGDKMEDMDRRLKFVMQMFQYLSNKQYFELCLRNLLSMRLLYDKNIQTIDYDITRMLKQECGVNYTSNLMDIIDWDKRAKDLKNEFKESQYKQGSNKSTVDFSVLCFSHESWIVKEIQGVPVVKVDEQFEDAETVERVGNTPEFTHKANTKRGSLDEISGLEKEFEEFYKNKYKRRRLDYLPHMGTAELELGFKGREYELKLTSIQAHCLLLFSGQRYVNLETIEQTLGEGYKEGHARKHLGLLNSGSIPLVKFYTPSITFETCNTKDYFELNLDFHSESTSLDFRPSREELFELGKNYESTGQNLDDMVPFVESTIVRYLKRTMEASSTTLFKLCNNSKKFTITREHFNQVIDSLVEREFIQFNKLNKEFIQYMP